jgi:homospermidine synthase
MCVAKASQEFSWLFRSTAPWEGDLATILVFSNDDVAIGDYFYVRRSNGGIDVHFGAPPSLAPAR